MGWETGGDGVACVTLQGSSVWTCGVFPVWETGTVGVVFPWVCLGDVQSWAVLVLAITGDFAGQRVPPPPFPTLSIRPVFIHALRRRAFYAGKLGVCGVLQCAQSDLMANLPQGSPDTSETFDISPDVLESRLRRCVVGTGILSSGAVRLHQRGVWCVDLGEPMVAARQRGWLRMFLADLDRDLGAIAAELATGGELEAACLAELASPSDEELAGMMRVWQESIDRCLADLDRDHEHAMG